MRWTSVSMRWTSVSIPWTSGSMRWIAGSIRWIAVSTRLPNTCSVWIHAWIGWNRGDRGGNAVAPNPPGRIHCLPATKRFYQHSIIEVPMSRANAFRRAVTMAWLFLAVATPILAQATKSFEPYFNVASPLELTAAKKADRVAWTVYEKGLRNVYTAGAPDFKPVRVTRFLEDDGQEVSDVNLSDDGSMVVFVRGHAQNREGWVANPNHNAEGSERAIWAARAIGGPAWRLVAASAPQLSPDGKTVIYVKEGQIYRVRTAQGVVQDSMDRGLKPFIKAW